MNSNNPLNPTAMITKESQTSTATERKTVSITRTFNRRARTVWEAWTAPESFKKWWGPTGYTCPYCNIDLRVGGKCVASMKDEAGKEIYSVGIFREIVPMKKLVYDDHFADSKGNIVPPSYYNMPGEWNNVQVTVTLEENGGKTNMTMNQEGIPAEMYDDCITGWNQSLDKIEKNLR